MLAATRRVFTMRIFGLIWLDHSCFYRLRNPHLRCSLAIKKIIVSLVDQVLFLLISVYIIGAKIEKPKLIFQNAKEKTDDDEHNLDCVFLCLQISPLSVSSRKSNNKSYLHKL